jgi:hypothetical protein
MKGLKWIALLLFAAYGAWRLFEWHWYLGIIPDELGTRYAMHIGSESGFMKGCGLAVFRLDRSTTRRIETQGVQFLNQFARQSRKRQDAYHTFQEWHSTPRPSDITDDQTLLDPGLHCSGASKSLYRQLEQAVRAPGSFYAFGPEKVLVVIPSQQVVVLSWYG